jgi:hypothetical protein
MIGETAAQRGWLSNHAATVPHQGVAGDRPPHSPTPIPGLAVPVPPKGAKGVSPCICAECCCRRSYSVRLIASFLLVA